MSDADGGESISDNNLVHVSPPGPMDATAFYESFFPMVYAYFVRRTSDVPTAEDLTAEAFDRLAAAWPVFRPLGDPDIATRVWVFRVAGNVLKNFWRYDSRRQARDDAWIAVQGPAQPREADADLRIALNQALAKLPPDDRNLLGLRFWDGLSAPEIAAVCECRPREVYTAVERCLRQLQRDLVSSTGSQHYVEN